jgi:translation initiation factor 2D
MFHKDGSFNTTQGKKPKDIPLKKSERRKLRDVFYSMISTNLPNTETVVLRDLVDLIFMDPSADVSIRKIKQKDAKSNAGATNFYIRSPSSSGKEARKTSVWPYTQFHQVLLIDVNQIMIPSLALLSVLPEDVIQSLPHVVVPSIVSKYICRGADLMRSGITSIPDQFLPGSLVVVSVRHNIQPFAIGFITKGTESHNIGPDTKGVGVEIITCYGDEIYRSQMDPTKKNQEKSIIGEGSQISTIGGGCFDHGDYGNVGFVDGKMVYGLIRPGQEHDSEDDNSESEHKDDEQQQEETGETITENLNKTDATIEKTNSQNDTENNVLEHAIGSMQLDDEVVVEVEETAKVSDESNAEEDLLCAFHKALVYMSKSDLPIPTSVFYSQHLLQARKEGSYIDLKATRWKKLGVFLTEQAQRGVISVGPSKDGKDPIAFIKSVDRSHIDLREARKDKNNSTENGEKNQTSKKTTKKKMALIDLFVIPQHIVNLLRLDQDDVKAEHAKSDTRKGTGYLTAPECREILNKYLIQNSLIDEFDHEMTQLDGPLCDALYRKTKKELSMEGMTKSEYEEAVTRKDLNTKWLEKLDKAYAIVSMPGSIIVSMRRGSPPKIHIEVSKRQGNKLVTIVRGLEDVSLVKFSSLFHI